MCQCLQGPRARVIPMFLLVSVLCWCALHSQASSVGSAAYIAPAQRLAKIDQHICAIFNGSVSCWGQDDGGALGYFTDEHEADTSSYDAVGTGFNVKRTGPYSYTSDTYTFNFKRYVPNDFTCTRRPGENPLNFSSTLGSAVSVHASSVSLASNRQTVMCALFSLGGVVCWGNSVQDLGVEDTSPLHPNAGGDPSSFVPVDFGTAPVTGHPMSMPVTAVALARGGGHSCIIRWDGKMQCFGENDFGQLGYGHTNTVGDGAISVSAAGPLELWDQSSPVVQIGLGNTFTCALLASGRAACWGEYNTYVNYLGQDFGTANLKIGGSSSHSVANLQPIVFGTPAELGAQLSVAALHSCMLTTSGHVYCWGRNQWGQLGLINGGALPPPRFPREYKPH